MCVYFNVLCSLLMTLDIFYTFIQVILCGGGSKVPLVQKMVSETFPNAKILNHIPPDEVIAIGAAKEVRQLQTLITRLSIEKISMQEGTLND